MNEDKYVVKGKSPFWKQDHYLNTEEDPRAHIIKRHIKHATPMSLEKATKLAKEWERSGNANRYKTDVVKLEEETDFKVSVEGLPNMFIKGQSQSEVKNNLRKLLRKPEMIKDVKRVTKPQILQTFRDILTGKENAEDGTDDTDE